MVAEHVLRATGLTVGCRAGCKILDHIQDATGWTEGAGCAIGVNGASWGALAGTHGTGCVSMRHSIHLSLSEADRRRSRVGAWGTGLPPGHAASGAGAWTRHQLLMASWREWRANIWLSTLDVGIPCSAAVICWIPWSIRFYAVTDGWVRC